MKTESAWKSIYKFKIISLLGAGQELGDLWFELRIML